MMNKEKDKKKLLKVGETFLRQKNSFEYLVIHDNMK